MTNVFSSILGAGKRTRIVPLFTISDPPPPIGAGQMLIAVEDDASGSLYVSELRLVEGSRRHRAVRH